MLATAAAGNSVRQLLSRVRDWIEDRMLSKAVPLIEQILIK